jgi:LPXTG-site transpeptidase (sortase) family protein
MLAMVVSINNPPSNGRGERAIPTAPPRTPVAFTVGKNATATARHSTPVVLPTSTAAIDASPAVMATTPVPEASQSTATIARIVIPAIGVDAPIIVLGLDENRIMQAPQDPYAVAWYDFTSRPGAGGNAVFSGHVDWAQVGPAVFYDLRDVDRGDLIEVFLEDGTLFSYRVSRNIVVDEQTTDVDRIIGPTGVDSVTLITCTGDFDRSTGRYDARLVIRAERVPNSGG